MLFLQTRLQDHVSFNHAWFGNICDGVTGGCHQQFPVAASTVVHGRSLRFAATAQGIVIYALGENLADDGGNVASTTKTCRPLDVGFRLLHPEKRGLKILDIRPPDEEPPRADDVNPPSAG